MTTTLLYGPINTEPVGELKFDPGSTWSHILNSPGSATFTVPINQSSLTAADTNPGRTVLYVLRDDVPQWSGLIWVRNRLAVEQKLVMVAKGWHSYFRHRYFRTDRTWTATDQLTIARAMIDHAQAVSGGDVGITTTDTNVSGLTRDRTFLGRERKNYAEALEELAAVSNGFDFRFDTFRNGAGDIEVAFRTSYPATGRATAIVLEVGSNCSLVEDPHDAEGLANHVTSTGAGQESDMLIAVAQDAASLNTYPLLEAVTAYTDVTNPTTLASHAARDLARRVDDGQNITVTMHPGAAPTLGTYLVGDRVRFIDPDPFEPTDDTFRVLEIKVDLSDSETVTLKLGPVDPILAPDIGSVLRETQRRLAQLERARRTTP